MCSVTLSVIERCPSRIDKFALSDRSRRHFGTLRFSCFKRPPHSDTPPSLYRNKTLPIAFENLPDCLDTPPRPRLKVLSNSVEQTGVRRMPSATLPTGKARLARRHVSAQPVSE